MMKDDNLLLKKCMELPYSNNGELTEEVFSDTSRQIRSLCEENDICEVVGTLSTQWSYEKAVQFFNKFEFARSNRSIKTIASSYFRAYDGGVERVNAELMNIWTEMGLNIIFFTDEPENEMDFPYPESVKRIIIPPITDLPARLHDLQENCIKEKVDLFVNHNWSKQKAVWECILMRMLGIYHSVYCHSHFAWFLGSGKSYLYQPDSFRISNAVIAISETNARFYQLNGCRTYLCQNPVPDDLKERACSSPLDSKHVLLIGRLSEEKYPLEAFQVFKNVLERIPDLILDVVGDGDEYPKLKSFVDENNMGSSIVFHGRKGNDEIAGYYKTASAVLFTSKMEGYPMIVLESMAYGVPIVMYELPYLSILKEGRGILTSSMGNISEMADNLYKVMADTQFRRELGEEARKGFNELLDYNMKEAWSDIFDICTGREESRDNPAYYDPLKLSSSDRCIIPMLMDKIKGWYDLALESSTDYKVGKAVLKYPRMIKKALKPGIVEEID